MVQIGSVGGALIAFIACDKIGVYCVTVHLVHVTDICRSHLGYSSIVCRLDCRRHHLHHSRWKLWTSPCWTIYYGPWNRTNDCRCTSIPGRSSTTKYSRTLHLYLFRLSLSRYHAWILRELGYFTPYFEQVSQPMDRCDHHAHRLCWNHPNYESVRVGISSMARKGWQG